MYHFSSALILGITACVLFILLRKMNFPLLTACFASLIYYVHPLFVSTTAHIPNRAELLLSLFSLLSFLFLIEFLNKKKPVYLFWHGITFTIALFCKETAAFLPFIFILYYFIRRNKNRPAKLPYEKKDFVIPAIYGVAGLFWYWLRSIALRGVVSFDTSFGLKPFFLNLRIIPEAMSKFFLPSDIAPIPGYSLFKTISGLIIIILMIVVFFKINKAHHKEKIFGISWFMILLVPSMLYKAPYFDYLDHRFFLPLTGIIFFVLFSIPEKWHKTYSKKFIWLPIVAVIALSTATIIKSRSYSDPMTFCNSSIKHNPNSFLAYHNRGLIYAREELYDKAFDDFNKAIDIYPDFPYTYNNRAIIFENRGLHDKAIADYTKAIELKRDYLMPYMSRGLIYENLGLIDNAINDYLKATEIQPDYAMAYNNLGIVYHRKGLVDNACQEFKKAMDLGLEQGSENFNRLCK